MFNRTIQLKLAKAPKSAAVTLDSARESKTDYAQIVHQSSEDIVRGVVIIIAATIAMDTIREIAIRKFT